jgi:hypothetical protein
MREYRVKLHVILHTPVPILPPDGGAVRGYFRNFLVRALTSKHAVRLAWDEVEDGVVQAESIEVEDQQPGDEDELEEVIGRSGRILYEGPPPRGS